MEEILSSLYEVLNSLELNHSSEGIESSIEEKLIEYQSFALAEFVTTSKSIQNIENFYTRLCNLEDRSVTLLLFDIDNFSLINNLYGFDIGNEVLKKVGELLSLIIPPEIELYKYTSDEFALILNQDYKAIKEVVEQIQAYFLNTCLFDFENQSIYITLSCGIASSSVSQTLVYHAEQALKHLKNRDFTNKYYIYGEGNMQDVLLTHNHSLLTTLRSYFESDKIVPYYHPIVCNQSQEIISYECLARIIDGENILQPISFLKISKQLGLLPSITKIIIKKSFYQFSFYPDQMFSINITQEDLLDLNFVNYVMAQRSLYKINPKCVIFEILEDILFDEDNMVTLENIKKLKSLGFKIAFDDFGTRNSNFTRFQHIGVDFIKIDGQFIRDISENRLNQNIVKSIVQLAKELNLKVVAEYVASKEDFEFVKSIGIDYSQGYYFYKPLQKPIEKEI